jgi:hypothetical protein
LFSLQDVTEHLQVATHQAGDVQMIHVYGNGVLFPDMHATLPTVGFTRSEITDR